MDRWLKDREKLSHKLERMKLKRKRLLTEKGQASQKLVEDLDDQIENLTSNVNYLQENIMECQQNIMQMEQTNEDLENEANEEEILTKMIDVNTIELPGLSLHFKISCLFTFSNSFVLNDYRSQIPLGKTAGHGCKSKLFSNAKGWSHSRNGKSYDPSC